VQQAKPTRGRKSKKSEPIDAVGYEVEEAPLEAVEQVVQAEERQISSASESARPSPLRALDARSMRTSLTAGASEARTF
jgi:hypothetical protein